jgi:site-specific recombinase XerD
MKQRSLLVFEQTIKSEKTRKNYIDHLDRFLKFTKIKDCDSLLKIEQEQLQRIIEDYVLYLKNTVNPNSVPTYMTGIKHFFVMNRKPIFWEIIQKMFPEKIKRAGYNAWSTEQIKEMLEVNTTKRNKAIIHFMASTGSRIGIFDYPLQLKHLKDMGDDCKAILLYADEVDEYYSFLTPEATKAVDDYLRERQNDNEKFYQDTPIFREKYSLGISKPRQLTRAAVISMIHRTIKTSKVKRSKVGKHFDIQMDHGFRKRFNIILKLNNNINSNIAEKIMGHSITIPLDNTYLPAQNPEVLKKCFDEFRKAIPELTINDSLKKQIELDKLTKEKSELENVNLILKQTIKEKDEITKKLHDGIITTSTNKLIHKKVEEFLKSKNI